MKKNEDDLTDSKSFILSKNTIGTDINYKHEIVWPMVVAHFILNVLALYGVYVMWFGSLKWITFCYVNLLGALIILGICSGYHRYFTHRCYKATLPLKIYFIISCSMAGQNSIFTWARDHRLHHRFSDTDADPHNSNRGFFFSHMGWLMTKKHPLVIEQGKKIDMTDLLADPLVMFQHRHVFSLFFVFGAVIPLSISVYFFEESLVNAIFAVLIYRYVLGLHLTWFVNSLAHFYGTRPYDQSIRPVESWFVSLFTWGEGWHNYHHTYPWDYKASEFGMPFNINTWFIKTCERLGLAYDLKSVEPELVAKRIAKTGDNTHYIYGNDADRAEVTAFGPLHPLNPTYTTTKKQLIK